jgi:hypothetical protein
MSDQHFNVEFLLQYLRLNPFGRGEARVGASERLGLPFVATLGFKMDILKGKPTGFEGSFL